MTSLVTTRDALAEALRSTWGYPSEKQADLLLASGAVVSVEDLAAQITAAAERDHAAFAAQENEVLAEFRKRHGVDLEARHWNRHDDGCGMCGFARAAPWLIAAFTRAVGAEVEG